MSTNHTLGTSLLTKFYLAKLYYNMQIVLCVAECYQSLCTPRDVNVVQRIYSILMSELLSNVATMKSAIEETPLDMNSVNQVNIFFLFQSNCSTKYNHASFSNPHSNSIMLMLAGAVRHALICALTVSTAPHESC